jgi:hypothetical protein
MMRVTGKSIRPEQKTGSLPRRFQNSGRPNSRIEAKINSADLQSGVINPNENNDHRKIKIIKLDCTAPVTYLSFGRNLLDDFGFCDIERNRTNFPSDSNIKPRCNITAWFTIIC